MNGAVGETNISNSFIRMFYKNKNVDNILRFC